jgi:hypothetical protein
MLEWRPQQLIEQPFYAALLVFVHLVDLAKIVYEKAGSRIRTRTDILLATPTEMQQQPILETRIRHDQPKFRVCRSHLYRSIERLMRISIDHAKDAVEALGAPTCCTNDTERISSAGVRYFNVSMGTKVLGGILYVLPA